MILMHTKVKYLRTPAAPSQKSLRSTHGKNYDSPEEEQKRFKIFQDNLKTIEEHNKKYEAGETTWQMGINQFADLTADEMKQRYTGIIPPKDK
ncbi:unnamed protein product [Callosobruchus maculatus]|uniref:Cathepsin propeptide inhibitor domain-containing protein n=1 Tax=Callosobruchus maculatus TaxID=64391 RepID=A0A653BTS3_CALMS|nr:unnamed protein product [Callosobruchus maculatus]